MWDIVLIGIYVKCGGGPVDNTFFVYTINVMKITFDATKRDLALRDRRLDFRRADEVFAGWSATAIDDRFDYGEKRFITAGYLDGRVVAWSWWSGRSVAKPATSFQ